MNERKSRELCFRIVGAFAVYQPYHAACGCMAALYNTTNVEHVTCRICLTLVHRRFESTPYSYNHRPSMLVWHYDDYQAFVKVDPVAAALVLRCRLAKALDAGAAATMLVQAHMRAASPVVKVEYDRLLEEMGELSSHWKTQSP